MLRKRMPSLILQSEPRIITALIVVHLKHVRENWMLGKRLELCAEVSSWMPRNGGNFGTEGIR